MGSLAVSTFEYTQTGEYGTDWSFSLVYLKRSWGIVSRSVGAFDLYISDSIRKIGGRIGGG